MTYTVRIKRSAAKELARLPKRDRERIVNEIDSLGNHPHAGQVLKGGLQGLRRIRVGIYRVVYEVMDGILVVLVVRVAHRKNAYLRW